MKKKVRILSGTSLQKMFVVSIPENEGEKSKVIATENDCVKYFEEKNVFHPMYPDELLEIYNTKNGVGEILWDEETNSPQTQNNKIIFVV
jgi:hypothetical protein